MEKKLFRVALAGCGAISRTHIRAILAAGQTLVALCDPIPEKAKALADSEGLSGVPVYTEYPAMLKEARPDIVHICTPHDLHVPMAVEALERGIHVLCEKPLAISEEQLRILAGAVRRSRATFGVCQQNRYEPNMLRLRELVTAPPLGGFATVVWKRDEAYYRSGAWRGTLAHEGGGVLINQALHTLDLMQWYCGMPTHVTAHCFNDYHKGTIEVEDTAACTFEGENGLRWQFFATTSATVDFPIQISLRLATGELAEVQNHQFTLNHRLLTGSDDTGDGKWVWGDGHKALVTDFYRCVRDGKPFALGFAEGEKVIRLLLSIYRSGGKRVAVIPSAEEI